jgi:hypothetical protein
MKSDNFDIEYKRRKAKVTTQLDNKVEIFRFEWEDDGSLDFLYMGAKDMIPGWESHTVLKPKEIAALGLLIENKTK